MTSFHKKGAQVNQFENPIADTGFPDIEDDEEHDNIKIGMTVNSDDEAYELYCRYAACKGFDVRRGNSRKINGVIRQRDFLCSCFGVYKDGDPLEQTKINRIIRRTDCRAFVRFTITDGVWEITHLNKEHNHDFVEPKHRHFLKINRKIDTASASILSSMVDAGIGATKAYSYVSKEVGGSDLVGFTKRDCQNFANERKMNLIEKGDAKAVMTRFRQCQVDDPMFFHLEDFDDDNRLSKVFWRDGRSKLDYDCFGDVMIFDTTYHTNKYNMIFAPFVGINHHRKSVFFGCAFLPDEKSETFIWLFQTFLVAMENRAPRTIFTDQAQAIANAIKVVFPNTCHRLCSWHISKNATQRIGSLYANSEFKRLFSRCLYDRMPELEFEATWSEMITKFNLDENKWLKTLYGLKDKWSPAFSLDTFSACMKSTQRSESMNNVLHKISCKTMSLRDFLSHYEEQCLNMRSVECEEDNRCAVGTPRIHIRWSKILMQAADVYTLSIFSLFESEFMSSLTVHLEQVSHVAPLYTYRSIEECFRRYHTIEFNTSNFSVSCSCKLFESMGWLCRHLLKVFNVWSITTIPTQYILNRWTKEAKKGNLFQETDELHQEKKSSITLRETI